MKWARLGPVALAALLAATATGYAAVALTIDVSTSPAAATPPVVLAAGTAGSTTLGASATSAQTSLSGTQVGSEALRAQGTGYDAYLRLVSATGLEATDAITIELGGPLTTSQVVVQAGLVTQSSGTAVTIPTDGLDAMVTATMLLGGTRTLKLEWVVQPTGAANPALVYGWTVALTP